MSHTLERVGLRSRALTASGLEKSAVGTFCFASEDSPLLNPRTVSVLSISTEELPREACIQQEQASTCLIQCNVS